MRGTVAILLFALVASVCALAKTEQPPPEVFSTEDKLSVYVTADGTDLRLTPGRPLP